MSAPMSYLQAKREAVEAIGNKLTPEYLDSASKTNLENDKDEIDNIVKSHHDMFDATDWAKEPAAFTIGYETLKERIGTLKDSALRKINDQLNKLESNKPPRVKTPTNQGGTTVPGEAQGEGQGSKTNQDGKTVPETKNQPAKGTATMQGGSSEGTPGTVSNGNKPPVSGDKEMIKTLEKILGEFEILKQDIKHVREEAVAKEVLANEKIQGLETKLTRQIREADPQSTGSTTRDESEFTAPPKKQTEESYQDKIRRQLNELKNIVEKARKAKNDLTFKTLIKTNKEALITRKGQNATAIASFHLKVALLEVMTKKCLMHTFALSSNFWCFSIANIH